MKQLRKFARTRIPLATAILTLLVVSCAGQDKDTGSLEAERPAIYAAAIRQIYREEDTFGGTLQPPALYILSETNDGVGDPSTESLPPEAISPELQSQIEEELSDLGVRIIWVMDQQDVPLDPQNGGVEGGGAILALGNLHQQSDGSVHVPASIYVAYLAGGGQTFVIEEIEGEWKVTGNTGAQWIS